MLQVAAKFCRNKITVSFFSHFVVVLLKGFMKAFAVPQQKRVKTKLTSNFYPSSGLSHQGLNLKISTISAILKFRVKTGNNLKQICISLEIWYRYVTFAL